MKDFLLFLPITVVYLVFKSTVFPSVPIPDVPLLIVFYIAYTRPSVEGALLGFVIGYIEDAFTAGIFGSTSFSLVVIFLAVHMLSRKMHFSTPMIRAGAAAALVLAKGALIYLVLSFTDFDVPFLSRIAFQAVITGAFAPPIITLFARLTRMVRPRTLER
jgi:rod shape-determining protein MreD